MRNTAAVTRGKPIAAFLHFISGVSAINPLVAFYDIHGGKREVLFFYFDPDTTRVNNIIIINSLQRNHFICLKDFILIQSFKIPVCSHARACALCYITCPYLSVCDIVMIRKPLPL
jgi:hypothetical protein